MKAKLDIEGMLGSVSEKANHILDATQKTLGFVPNMYKNMSINTALLDAYTYSYQSFRQNSGFTPVEQEVIFLSVAYSNNCEYCVAAHSFVGDKMTKVPTSVTDAIRVGEPITDNKLNALSEFTKILTESRGNATDEQLNRFLSEGFMPVHVLGIIAGIAVKTMSNYSNHITQPNVDTVFESRKWTK